MLGKSRTRTKAKGKSVVSGQTLFTLPAMNSSARIPAHVTLPAANQVIHAYGEELQFHLTGPQTGGKYVLWTEITPPGGGPPPHYHENEDELFHVLAGRVEFFKDGRWTEVPVGTSVFMPRGVVHGFRNVGSTPLKQLILTSPAGFDVFIQRSAPEFTKPGGPDMGQVIAIAAEHGIHFVQL
jgi:quercetin dioxygenase-like cupin family protein